MEAGVRVVVCKIALRIHWFKQVDFVSVVAMLSHRITERILGDRHDYVTPRTEGSRHGIHAGLARKFRNQMRWNQIAKLA